MLRKDKDGLIRYNYPKVAATKEESQTYEILEGMWS